MPAPRWPSSPSLAGPTSRALTPETLIRLTVDPAAAPKPALRYLLLPELKEMNPGNPIQGYLKCFMEQQKFFFDKESFQRREKLLVMPLKELPARELQDYGGLALKQADWAARLDNPDWQILLNIEGRGDLRADPRRAGAPTPGQCTQGAHASRGRPGPLRRRPPNGQDHVRHVAPPGRAPDVRRQPVGVAIANLAIGPLEEMLEQPGCPNLYWALTNLPNPLVPLDTGDAR